MNAKVLITGGAGFIGTHLARFFAAAGKRVTVLDLVDPEAPVPGVHYLRGDVRRPEDLAGAASGQDAIFHWAAMVSVPECQEKPLESYETNFLSTVRLLDLVKAENARRPADKKVRVLFSGSSAVYGTLGDNGQKLSEALPLADPLSFYGAQKLASEQAIRIYARTHGIPAVVFRFFNVFGPGQKATSPYSGVISVFAKNSREGKPFLLNGGGSQTRDFVSVHDIVAACDAALASRNSELLAGCPVNLGSSQPLSIHDLAQLIAELSGKGMLTETRPPRSGDILHSCADISRARELLGWKPAVNLRPALKELL
jgi:UDP-glucose 4-epimerase